MTTSRTPSPQGTHRAAHWYLLLATLLCIGLTLGFSGWGLSSLLRQHLILQFRSELLAHLDHLSAQLTLDDTGLPGFVSGQGDPRFNARHSGLYWQIDRLNDSNDKLPVNRLRSLSLQGYTLKMPEHAVEIGVTHQHRLMGPAGTELRVVEHIILIDPVSRQIIDTPPRPGSQDNSVQLRLIIAGDDQELLEFLSRFNSTLWLAFSLLGMVMAVMSFMQILILRRPLKRLQQSLETVHRGQSSCLEGDYSGDLQALVDEFNLLLAQNLDVVEGAHQRAGRFAHALKTPLGALSQAADDRQQTVNGLATAVHGQVKVAHQQIDHHLARSRAAAAAQRRGIRCEVLPVLEKLVRQMKTLYADKALSLTIHAQNPAPFFRGDKQDLEEILGNQLDEACQWASTSVEIRLLGSGRQFLVSIDDDGPGMSVKDQHGQRRNQGLRDKNSVPGADLDLSTVLDLVRLYNGKLDLGNSPLGGLQAQLILPRSERE